MHAGTRRGRSGGRFCRSRPRRADFELGRKSRLVIRLAVLALLGFAPSLPAQPPLVNPRAVGIDLPPGPVRPGGGTVHTSDEAGDPVVARLHVRIGDAAVVELPDGQLVPRTANQFEACDEPFDAIAGGILSERLEEEFPGFRQRRTRHYVYVYNTSDNFQQVASRILETMYPGITAYARNQGIDVRHPDVPLVVVMFRTKEEFQDYRPMPDGVLAYYHTLTNRVVIHEESDLLATRPDLARRQAISTFAHEGAHQILHNVGVQVRLSYWPTWMNEGLAEYFAPTTTDHRMRWKGAGEVNDLRMFELEQYLKGEAFTAEPGQLVRQTVGAARLTSTGYACAWSLTHYLAETRRDAFGEFLRALSERGPLEGFPAEVSGGIVSDHLDEFHTYFGEDLEDHEVELVRYLERLPYRDPFADLPHYVAMLAYRDGRRTVRRYNLFHTQPQAESWLERAGQQLTAEQRRSAASHVQRCANRVLADEFARRWANGR